MIKAVIFDMFETLITHYNSPVYFGAQMAENAGIEVDKFQALWRQTEQDRTIGKVTVDEVVEMILKKNNCYSEEMVKKIVSMLAAIGVPMAIEIGCNPMPIAMVCVWM